MFFELHGAGRSERRDPPMVFVLQEDEYELIIGMLRTFEQQSRSLNCRSELNFDKSDHLGDEFDELGYND